LPEDVIASVLAFHQRRAVQGDRTPAASPPGYRAESLRVLFGTDLP